MSATSLEVDIFLQPKQKQFWDILENKSSRHNGIGGARGGGKSGGTRRLVLLRRFTYPGTNGLILRRTYDELRKNHIDPLFREYPFMLDWWNEGKKSLTLPNGSTQYFGYAEHEADVLRYVGDEFADIAVEEAGYFTEREMNILDGSCRWVGSSPIVPKMIYSFMPGGPGHSYLKRVFIDGDYRETEFKDNYSFVEAKGWDNVEHCKPALAHDGITEKEFYSWMEDRRKAYFITRSDYGRGLAANPDKQLREAWLEGSWTLHEGVVFAEINPDIHDLDRWIDPKNPQQLNEWAKHLKMIAGLDHATTGVTACVEHGVDWDENLFAIEEYYERNRTIETHAKAIIGMLTRWGNYSLAGAGRQHGQQYVVVDPSTEAKTLQRAQMTGQMELTSVLDEYARQGLRMAPAHRSMISVGIDVLHGLLKVDPQHRNPFTQQMGSPRMFISRTRCPELWREIRELQKMRDTSGNWVFIGSDHGLDTTRYVAMTRPTPAARAEQDMSNFPPQEQMKKRVEDNFFKTWGKEASSNQHFGGMFRR